EPQLAQQRKQAVQNLGDPAAHRGRVHHVHGSALQRLRQHSQFFHLGGAQQGRILVQGKRWSFQQYAHELISLSTSSLNARRAVPSVFVWPSIPSVRLANPSRRSAVRTQCEKSFVRSPSRRREAMKW